MRRWAVGVSRARLGLRRSSRCRATARRGLGCRCRRGPTSRRSLRSRRGRGGSGRLGGGGRFHWRLRRGRLPSPRAAAGRRRRCSCTDSAAGDVSEGRDDRRHQGGCLRRLPFALRELLLQPGRLAESLGFGGAGCIKLTAEPLDPPACFLGHLRGSRLGRGHDVTHRGDDVGGNRGSRSPFVRLPPGSSLLDGHPCLLLMHVESVAAGTVASEDQRGRSPRIVTRSCEQDVNDPSTVG